MKDAPSKDERFTLSGRFWLSDDNSESGPGGQLTYDPDEGIELRLVPDFHDMSHTSSREVFKVKQHKLAFGRTVDGLHVILYGLAGRSSVDHERRIISTLYEIENLAIGTLEPAGNPLLINRLFAEFSGFEEWAGGHEMSLHKESASRHEHRITLTVKSPPPVEVNLPSLGCTILIQGGLSHSFSGWHKHTFGYEYGLTVQTRRFRRIEFLLEQLKYFHTFLLMACPDPMRLSSVSFRMKSTFSASREQVAHARYHLYPHKWYPSPRRTRNEEDRVPWRASLLFTLSDIEGSFDDAYRRWINLCMAAPEAVRTFEALEMRYFHILEYDFLKAIQVIEAYYRCRNPKPQRKIRLREMLDWFIQEISVKCRRKFNLDRRSARNFIVDARDYYTHYNTRTSFKPNLTNTHVSTNRLRAAIRYVWLKDLGFRKDLLDRWFDRFINPRWFAV
ncbi:hypothetical protein IIA79_00310 [bacterium]|nr:hypothetical protein [bacterium]